MTVEAIKDKKKVEALLHILKGKMKEIGCSVNFNLIRGLGFRMWFQFKFII